MPDHPKQISGGCLCGAVRYSIAFPDAASWPPGVSLRSQTYIASPILPRVYAMDIDVPRCARILLPNFSSSGLSIQSTILSVYICPKLK